MGWTYEGGIQALSSKRKGEGLDAHSLRAAGTNATRAELSGWIGHVSMEVVGDCQRPVTRPRGDWQVGGGQWMDGMMASLAGVKRDGMNLDLSER